jgi:hypothetical protein
MIETKLQPRCNGSETNSGAKMITLWGRNNSTNVKKVRWVLEVELLRPHSVIIFAPEFVSLPLQRDRRSCWDKVNI